MGALFALVLQAAVPQAAAANVSGANEADLRCLAVVASGGLEAASRGGQAAGAMYFVGRIDARTPGFDYRVEMLRLIRSRTDLGADRVRCSTELKNRGAALAELSRGLQAELAK
jgi:hypothetical protein